MHTAREEELIALAGELESELMRISQNVDAREEDMRAKYAHQEHALYSALNQVESLKKQLKLHVDDMTAEAAGGQPAQDKAPASASAAAAGGRWRGKNRGGADHRRLSGEYGFPSQSMPLPPSNTTASDDSGTVAMVELKALMRGMDAGHASTVSAPAYSGQSPDSTARMARQLNRPGRRNVFRRVVHRLVGGRRADRRRRRLQSANASA